MAPRLHKHIVQADAARRFYFDLRAQGAVPRSSPAWTWYFAIATPISILLVWIGATVYDADLGRANSWGIAGALLLWPLLLWLNPLWYATLAFLRWTDAEGWHAAVRHPTDRRPKRPQVPTLKVRYRIEPFPLVRVGSRNLFLRNLRITREASGLVVWRESQAVASLDLTGDAAVARTWDDRPKA